MFLSSFSTSRCFVLFEVILLLILCNLASKSVFVIKFSSANLALNKQFSLTTNIRNFFSTAVNAELVAKPVILGILFSVSVILAFKSVVLARSLVSGIFFSKSDLSVSYVVFKTNYVVSMLPTFATNFSYTVFLTTSFFTTLLSLAKSLGTDVKLSIFNLSTSVFS